MYNRVERSEQGGHMSLRRPLPYSRWPCWLWLEGDRLVHYVVTAKMSSNSLLSLKRVSHYLFLFLLLSLVLPCFFFLSFPLWCPHIPLNVDIPVRCTETYSWENMTHRETSFWSNSRYFPFYWGEARKWTAVSLAVSTPALNLTEWRCAWFYRFNHFRYIFIFFSLRVIICSLLLEHYELASIEAVFFSVVSFFLCVSVEKAETAIWKKEDCISRTERKLPCSRVVSVRSTGWPYFLTFLIPNKNSYLSLPALLSKVRTIPLYCLH